MTQTTTPVNGGAARDDRVLDALARIERRLARVEATLDQVSLLSERAPAMLAMLTDTFDDKVARGRDAGIDIDERLRVVVGVAERLTTPAALRMAETVIDNLEALERLFISGVLAPGPVDVVSKIGDALADVERQGERRAVGAWGALQALRDPDVQKALGFVLELARRFGRSLDSQPAAAELPASASESR